MMNVALTGNIAAGKSTVAEHFRGWGATIIDADHLVREAQQPGSPFLGAIAGRFGPNLILANGELDRGALRRIVMADAAARADLNAIMHPEVRRRRQELLEQARARGDRIVVNDIPLLFEADDPLAFDAVVLVDAPAAVRRARLMGDRGLAAEEAEQLMDAQLETDAKRRWGENEGAGRLLVIDNTGDPALLERRTRAVWADLVRRAR